MNFLEKLKESFFNNIIIYGCLLLMMVVSLSVNFLGYNHLDKKYAFINTIQNDNEQEISINDNSERPYKVEIKGEVVNPGVYEVASDSRVIDVIELAGGLLSDADTSVNNLGKLVEDEMVIIIYSQEEVKNFNSVVQSEEEKNSKCSNFSAIQNDSCIESNNNDRDQKNVTVNKISINKASKEELMSLSGIGEAKATSIIAYRNTNGSFKTIEEIMKVSGIGESVFAKIKDYITVE